MERMLEKGLVDPKEMEKAYFWRVKPGMLFGFFDSQIESAFADRRIVLLGLGSDRNHFTASFRSVLKIEDGDMEVQICEDFFNVYSEADGVSTILDLSSFLSGFGVDAYVIRSYRKESLAITTGYMDLVCWRYMDKNDNTVRMLDSHPIVDRLYESLIKRAGTIVYRRDLNEKSLELKTILATDPMSEKKPRTKQEHI